MAAAASRAAPTASAEGRVENAIKHSHGVGTWVRVDVGDAIEDNRLWGWVKIEDDGPGIGAEHLARIFDRFYRIDSARTHLAFDRADGASRNRDGEDDSQGSGLGLALGRWIAQAHGGDIRVTSTVGLGSVFEVWLPVQAER